MAGKQHGWAVRGLFWLLAGLDAVVLALAVLAYAARWIDPRLFWPSELLAIAMPVLAAAVAVFALYWAVRRRRSAFLLHAVLLVAMALRLFPLQRFLPTPEPGPQDLVLMTFNVPRFGASAEQLEEDVARLFRLHRPDVAALQEAGAWREHGPNVVHPVDYLRTALDSLRYEMHMADRATLTTQPLLVRYEAAASGFEIIEDESRPLELFVGDEDGWEVVRTRFRWQGREAVLYNVHLRTYGDAKPWEDDLEPLQPAFWARYLQQYRTAVQRRALEAEQVAAWLEAETLPVIVAGDFNATADNWAFRQLARGKRDAFATSGRGWGGTYHAERPLFRIDFVLHSPEFQAVEAYVPVASFSDHRPLVARLRWRDGGRAD